MNNNFKNSKIIKCTINNKFVTKLTYNTILCDIYYVIGCGTRIIKNSYLNIKTIKKKDKGYYYLPHLGISYQGIDSNKCMKEIYNQCYINKISFDIDIELSNNEKINICINNVEQKNEQKNEQKSISISELEYFEKRIGVDIGYNDNLPHPDYPDSTSTKGFDKNLQLEEIIKLAKDISGNIIIKAGINEKWYITPLLI